MLGRRYDIEPLRVGDQHGLAEHAIPVRHFVLHAGQDTLRGRIEGDTLLGPSTFRLTHLESYAETARTWRHDQAEVIDTRHLTSAQTEASLAVLDWARSSGYERLWATVWEWNTASRRVLAKVGFTETGRKDVDAVYGTTLFTTRRL